MAMLRVSSYRKSFEDDKWSPNGGLRLQRAGRYRASARLAPADDCGCDKFDFIAAKALNKEGSDRFVQERTTIAALNDRLVKLIELAHCLEKENDSLECQIADSKENLNGHPASPDINSKVAKSEYNLEAVSERLRKQRDEIVCDTEESQEELECLQKECEKAAQQRVLVQQGQQDVAEVVDAVTAKCLASKQQVALYEESSANMETHHKTLSCTSPEDDRHSPASQPKQEQLHHSVLLYLNPAAPSGPRSLTYSVGNVPESQMKKQDFSCFIVINFLSDDLGAF